MYGRSDFPTDRSVRSMAEADPVVRFTLLLDAMMVPGRSRKAARTAVPSLPPRRVWSSLKNSSAFRSCARGTQADDQPPGGIERSVRSAQASARLMTFSRSGNDRRDWCWRALELNLKSELDSEKSDPLPGDDSGLMVEC